MPTDRRAQIYDSGPFPGAVVPQFPPELVAQVERLTGRRFDARLFETYERVRAWVDYQGLVLTPDLRASQVIEEPAPTLSAPPPIEDKRRPSRISSPDPADLGD